MTKPPLTEADFRRSAARLKCEVAAIRAVAEIESPKGPFLADGRPTILFEPHIFSRLTNRRYDRSHPDISYRSWKAGAYGPGGAHQHARLAEAASLDRNAALQSASWGAFQIMGFNYGVCGFAGIQPFVNAMYRSASAQLDAFCSYVINRGLADELQRLDWPGFAYGYNGAGYAAHGYDRRIEAAYRKWKKAYP